VGNKSDMADERRAVPYARAKALADEYGIAFFGGGGGGAWTGVAVGGEGSQGRL